MTVEYRSYEWCGEFDFPGEKRDGERSEFITVNSLFHRIANDTSNVQFSLNYCLLTIKNI